MKKAFLVLLVLLLAALTALYFVGGRLIGKAVVMAVNKYGPQICETQVELKDAFVSPLAGRGTLRGIFVGSPRGFKAGKSFSSGETTVDIGLMSLFSDCVVIDEITVIDPEFVYETTFFKSNLGVLQKTVEKNTASTAGKEPAGTAKQPEQPQQSSEAEKKIQIRKFAFKGGLVTLNVAGSTVPVPLPPITMENIGTKEGGISPSAAAGMVMKHVLNTVAEAAVKGAMTAETEGKDGRGAAKEAGSKAVEGLKGIFKRE